MEGTGSRPKSRATRKHAVETQRLKACPDTEHRLTGPPYRINIARLAQVSFDFAQDKLSFGKRTSIPLGMTIRLPNFTNLSLQRNTA